MNYQFSYLIGDSAILVIWIILFLFRKDVRKEMLFISVLFGFVGLMVEPVFTTDWWHPFTVTNTRIGLEDFLFGFVVGGVAAVIYEEIFRKRLKLMKAGVLTRLGLTKFGRGETGVKFNTILILSILGAVLFFGSFFILKIHSFWCSLLAVLATTFVIWIKRKDLILDSLISGFLLSIISFAFFVIPEAIAPGWVLNHWHIENLTGIVVLKMPLEDLIWFFTVGLLIGPLYEFWRGYKLVSIKR